MRTPWFNAQAGFQISGRVEAGPGAAARIDQSKVTGRGRNFEVQGDWTTGQVALVVKMPQSKRGPFSVGGKATMAGQPAPPLNYAIGTAGSVELAGRSDNWAVKVEPTLWAAYTIHGGPTLMTAAAAGLFLGLGELEMTIVPFVLERAAVY